MLVWCELGEEPDGELVALHDVQDGGVGGKTGEECLCCRWIGEVREGSRVVKAKLQG